MRALANYVYICAYIFAHYICCVVLFIIINIILTKLKQIMNKVDILNLIRTFQTVIFVNYILFLLLLLYFVITHTNEKNVFFLIFGYCTLVFSTLFKFGPDGCYNREITVVTFYYVTVLYGNGKVMVMHR